MAATGTKSENPFKKKRSRSVEGDVEKNVPKKFHSADYQRKFHTKTTEKNHNAQMADRQFGNAYKFVIERERFKCGIDGCSLNLATGADLKKHMKMKHVKSKLFKCRHCSELIHAKSGHKKVSFMDALNHLDLHGNNLFQCTTCEKGFSSEFDVHLHMMRLHAVCEFKYNHRTVDAKGKITRDEVLVLFNCNFCQQGVQSTQGAVDHFRGNHNGANIDLLGTQFVRRTTPNMTIENIPPNKATFFIQQHIICDRCDYMVITKEGMLVHHLQSHAENMLAVRYSALMCFNRERDGTKVAEFTKLNFSFDRHIFYECAHCTGVKYFSSIVDVHGHWQEEHKKQDDGLPFRFIASPLVACIHCNRLSTFQGIRKHCEQDHPSKPFVAAKASNKFHCSLCAYTDVGLAEHFHKQHSDVLKYKIYNPVCLTDDIIDKLLAVNVIKKLKCTACGDIFETEDDIRDHALEIHKTFEFERLEIVDNQSVQLIGNCCRAEVNQITFFEHLANHLEQLSYSCPQCTFRSSDSFEFMNHGIEAHNIHNDACTLNLKYLNEHFWNSEYVFGNGLVLNKCNLVGTSIDDSQRFTEFAEALVMEKEKNYHSKH